MWVMGVNTYLKKREGVDKGNYDVVVLANLGRDLRRQCTGSG